MYSSNTDFCEACTNIHRYITHILTRHFIWYTMLVPGWTPLAFRTALICGIDLTSCYEFLVHIDCGFMNLFHHIPKCSIAVIPKVGRGRF